MNRDNIVLFAGNASQTVAGRVAQQLMQPLGFIQIEKFSDDETRIEILEKTLESKLGEYFEIVPKQLFEEAQEKAFEELDYEECTEEQCIMMIKEMLQVENSFQLVLISMD